MRQTYFATTLSSNLPGRGRSHETAVRPHQWMLTVTDDERVREVADLIVEAFRLSDTPQFVEVHRLLGLVAIEAAREALVTLDPVYPPGVVPLRRRSTNEIAASIRAIS